MGLILSVSLRNSQNINQAHLNSLSTRSGSSTVSGLQLVTQHCVHEETPHLNSTALKPL